MKHKDKFRRSGTLDENQKKLLGMLLVPAVIIILIFVIVLVDKARKRSDEIVTVETTVVETLTETLAPPETLEGETESTTEVVETEPTDAFETEQFVRDSVPEILELMKQYLTARAGADAETINTLYGIGTIPAVDLEAQKARMRNNSKYVTGFQSVGTYVKPGTVTDAWLVYTTAEIQFRSVKSTAPMLMWAYVTKDVEGNYRLSDNSKLPTEVQTYIQSANRTEEVRKLATDVNNRLKEALTSDEELNSVYGILNADSPIWLEEDAAMETQEVKILEETLGETASPEIEETAEVTEVTTAAPTTVGETQGAATQSE